MDYIGNELELFQHATNWKRYFSSAISKYIKGDTLEAGAGLGINTRYLINDRVTSWTFVEPDASLSSKIPANTSEISIPKKVITGTIDNIKTEKFDTIIYIDVLEHIEKSKEEIMKIRDLLKPGGHMIILVPAYQYLFNEFDEKLGHYRRYNKSLLRSEVNSQLEEKELFYLDSCGLMASLVNKLFLKQAAINLSQVRFWDKVMVNISKVTDLLTLKQMGKSLIGVYQKRA
jgi:SAM-dependent methyltransferase